MANGQPGGWKRSVLVQPSHLVRGQDASPHLKSASPEFFPTYTPEWLQVPHELIILINNLDPILLGKLKPFVESFRWIPPISSLVLLYSLSERLALAGDHLLELRLSVSHKLWNGVHDRLLFALGHLEEVRGPRYPVP